MTKTVFEGFFASPFFAEMHVDKDHFFKVYESIKSMEIKSMEIAEACRLEDKTLETFKSYNSKMHEYDVNTNLIKKGLVYFFYRESMFKFFCTEEEMLKVEECLKRGQYDSKVITIPYMKLCVLVEKIIVKSDVTEYIYPRIEFKLQELYQEDLLRHMSKKYSTLAKVVDKCAAGVKPQCYLEMRSNQYNDELLEYINSKYGYSKEMLTNCVYPLWKEKSSIDVLGEIIAPDTFNSDFTDLLGFASSVVKYNDLAHAKKIIDYAFSEVKRLPNGKKILENKLPIYHAKYLEQLLLLINKNRLEICTKSCGIDFAKIQENEYRGLIYPYYNVDHHILLEGKKLFEDLIKRQYPNHFKEVFDLLNDVNAKVDERGTTFKDYFEFTHFDYVNEAIKTMNVLCEGYSSKENVLNRLYYRLYLIHKASNVDAAIYEYLYYPLQVINEKFEIENAYIQNESLRNEKYEMLKAKLKEYHLTISDEFKHEYVIALLDRKYAKPSEVQQFPVLEQMGDAIYGLACARILFYNKNNKLSHEGLEKLVCAEGQLVVSNMLKINDMYISELQNELRTKYDENDYAIRNEYNQKHYLADSLEMIIGVIAKEFGVSEAMEFATNIVLKAYPNLEAPLIIEFNPLNIDIDRDYLSKIYPNPYAENEYEQKNYGEHIQLITALLKVINVFVYGNDTADKRRAITHSFEFLGDKKISRYQILINYLYRGLEDTINRLK